VDDSGSILGRGRDLFCSPPRPDRLWDPPSLLSKGDKATGRYVKLTIHLQLVLRLRMYGAVPPLYVFIMWCLIKHRVCRHGKPS